MYFLIDANIAAGYYLPRSLSSLNARKRTEIIVDHVRSHRKDHFIYLPNICIAETISVFIKHTFGKWNNHIKNKGTIDKRVYSSLVSSFQQDIHNAKFIYHYELNRYHILGINLVAPIDHYFQISRKSTKKKENTNPMKTFDHLVISMGINLVRIHGKDNVCILTADNRMSKVLDKCKSSIKSETINKLKLDTAEEVCGVPFSKDLFPKHLNLNNCKISELEEVFGKWPIEIGKFNKVYRWKKV